MAKKKPDVTITYCKPCGYEKRALELSCALKEALDLEPTLVPGKGGVFQISVGEEVVAKRSRAGFPTALDVVEAIKAQLA